MMNRILLGMTLLLVAPTLVTGQKSEPVYNYDEAKVGTYTLPDPLIMASGKRVTNRADWTRRRAELLQLFAENVYGQTPKKKVKLRFQTTSVDSSALNGLAIRKQVSIFLVDYPQLPSIDLLLYLPRQPRKPVPVFVGLNFWGNHSVTAEPGITLSTRWINNTNDGKVVNNRATEAARGMTAIKSWSVEMILSRGYGIATAYYGDIEPDYPAGWRSGIRSVLGDTTRADNWAAMGAWAWGLSRLLDYLQTDPAVDKKRCIAFGHSRLAKAMLWASAQDERFAAVVGNEPGEGGAALSRRWYGETVERLNTVLSHWFCGRYKYYNQRVADLPVDQHELLALIAPRPLYIASAEDDKWSDPKGEFLSTVQTEPVYHLFGKTALGTTVFPAVNQPIGQTVRYHIRTGKHDVTDYDWEQYLRFADELVR